MKKENEIKFLKGLITKFPMTIYLQEDIEEHIEEIS
jgi:hypothetical protein